MLIERSRGYDSVVSTRSFEEIEGLSRLADTMFIDFVRESGSVTGQGYNAQVKPWSQIDADLQPYVREGVDCMVIESKTDYNSVTTVVNVSPGIALGGGVAREIYVVDSEPAKPEYYEIEAGRGGYGCDLLGEIFIPGSHPELSQLAIDKGALLVEPNELAVRLITPEEHQRSHALGQLSAFTLKHVYELQKIYWQIAYPDQPYDAQSDSTRDEAYQNLVRGDSVGLRTGTKYLNCAKHEYVPNQPRGSVRTYMYLNYDVNIGQLKLHFDEDIAMAVDYGDQANAFFDSEGIKFDPIN